MSRKVWDLEKLYKRGDDHIGRPNHLAHYEISVSVSTQFLLRYI